MINAPVEEVIRRLNSGGYDPQPSGSGQWRSRCPAHRGRSSNLSIKAGDDGTVVLHCHHVDEGGRTCSAEAIVQSLGLEMRDLFPSNGNWSASPKAATTKTKKAWRSPEQAIDWLAGKEGGRVSNQGPWIYNDPDGYELMRVYRIDMPDRKKQFRPVYPHADGWHLGDPAKSGLPLYHLDELAAANIVFILEGEKCVNLIRALGLIATTSSHGAESPARTDWSPLAGKAVVLIPDNDKPGEGYANAVTAILAKLEPKPVVKVVRLPLENDGDDVEQWLGSCPDAWGPAGCRAELERLAAATLDLEAKPKAAAPGISPNGTTQLNGNGHVDDSRLAWFPHTDTGNAERMVARHGRNMRHCHPWKKWLHFDGRRWAVDDTAAIRRMAKATARKILAEASTVEDKEHREALVKLARATESKSRLSSMIDLASAEEGIPVLPQNLNTHRWLLNVENGTIDLRTGKLRPHKRNDLVTALAPVVFDPDAKCPQWDATLDRFFALREDLIAFWDRLCGIALTGDVSQQILPILHGVGDNGKSTMCGALLGMLGPDYATIAPKDFLASGGSHRHPTELAYLFGKRLVVVMEWPDGVRLNESLIKQLTGSDPITARRMNEDFWTFDPTHKLWMCANNKPVIKGTDHAIWRRPKLIPYDVKIEEQDKIINFPALLKGEYPGILARCVRGCLDWQRHGLQVPKDVSDATDGYRKEQDSLAAFIEEECVAGLGHKVKAGVMYQKYREKLQHLGEEPISLTNFGLAMKDRGYDKKESHGMWYLGIGLRSDAKHDNATDRGAF
ncbi:MAG: phage/plasmid primase, P4 family [Isosphaeraceae bacterium]